jgi:hypothetical protein
MHNSFPKPGPILMSEGMSKLIFLRIQILNQNLNSFRQISIFLDLRFESISKSYFEIF